MVVKPSELEFAGLLRQLRVRAELTQQELAEAAGLSPRSVSDLERGSNRTAREGTALLLAGALGLAEPARGLFVAAARGRGAAAEVLAAGRCVARDAPTATGGMHGFTVVVGGVIAASRAQAWTAIGRFFTTLTAAGVTGLIAALAVVLLAGGYATVCRVTA